MNSPQMQPVVSSNIHSVGYDYDTSTLYVKFNSGATYKYDGVPADEFEYLRGAASVGMYFNQNIKGVYPESRV